MQAHWTDLKHTTNFTLSFTIVYMHVTHQYQMEKLIITENVNLPPLSGSRIIDRCALSIVGIQNGCPEKRSVPVDFGVFFL